jgi:hypothetical protein
VEALVLSDRPGPIPYFYISFSIERLITRRHKYHVAPDVRKGKRPAHFDWRPIMSPMPTPFCCDEAMQLMAIVPPVGGPYGLRIYVCPRCERTRDMLIPAPALEAL